MEAHKSPIATEAVERIAALYAIENEIRGRCAGRAPPGTTGASAPTARIAMHDWLETSLVETLEKSDTSAAIRYALALWDALSATATTAASRSIIQPPKAPCARRHWPENYLFAGSDRGGERAATFYSLMGRPSSTAWIPRHTCAIS